MSQVVYVYLNSNPHGTTCPECRRYIGLTFEEYNRPRLPRHQNCYCYYYKITVPGQDPVPDPGIPDPGPAPTPAPSLPTQSTPSYTGKSSSGSGSSEDPRGNDPRDDTGQSEDPRGDDPRDDPRGDEPTRSTPSYTGTSSSTKSAPIEVPDEPSEAESEEVNRITEPLPVKPTTTAPSSNLATASGSTSRSDPAEVISPIELRR